MMTRKCLPLVLLLLLLTSCIFTGTEDNAGEKEKGVYPDLMMEDATFTIGQDGDSPIKLQGKSIVFYSKDNYAELTEFRFSQTNGDGETMLEGSAAKGNVDIGKNVIDFHGDVTFSKTDDGMLIKANNLYFNADSNEISAEGRVVVESQEGTFVGTGFMGDLAYSTYTFQTIERGELGND